MKFLTVLLLAVSATAVVVDPQSQGRRVVDRDIEQQIEAPKARDLAFEVRHANERRKAKKNGTETATGGGRKASSTPAKLITTRKSKNETAKGEGNGSGKTGAKASKKNKTASAVRRDGMAQLDFTA
jgi:hypothetical protein